MSYLPPSIDLEEFRDAEGVPVCRILGLDDCPATASAGAGGERQYGLVELASIQRTLDLQGWRKDKSKNSRE